LGVSLGRKATSEPELKNWGEKKLGHGFGAVRTHNSREKPDFLGETGKGGGREELKGKFNKLKRGTSLAMMPERNC